MNNLYKTPIVFLSNHMHFGGSQKIIYNIIDGISSKYIVYLISKPGYYAELLLTNNNVIFFDRKSNSPIKSIKNIQKKHAKIILHTHNRIDVLYKILLRSQDKHIHTFHSVYPNKNFIYRFIKPQISVSISKNVSSYLNKHNIENTIIYNGVSFKEKKQYKPVENKNTVKILFVGRLSEEKGIFNFVNAIKELEIKEINLDIIGDGILYKKIADYIKEHNLPINLLGFDTSPWDNINNYDLLVIPSLFEGFCLVVVEAAVLGIPIIANDLSVLKEILYFLPDESFFDIYNNKSINKTIHYAKDNILELKKIAKNNFKEIRRKFSTIEMVNNYIEIYEKNN